MSNLNGQEENKVGIPFIPQKTLEGGEGRIKDLKPGEVFVGNVLTRAYAKFDLDGNVEVFALANITAQADGDIVATASGDVTVTATNVAISANDTVTVNAATAHVIADDVELGGTDGLQWPALATRLRVRHCWLFTRCTQMKVIFMCGQSLVCWPLWPSSLEKRLVVQTLAQIDL